MAVDMFLKLEGIAGESRDAKHKDEIEIESFTWGAAREPSARAAAKVKVALQDFHFTMAVNKASPQLMLACASGKHLKHATLTARKAGKGQQEYLLYKLSDVLVSSYQTGGTRGGELPIDQISLNFSKVEFEYRPQKPDGSLGPAVKAGWDVKANKAV
jgi:type VI secretion system secreted protein Hcp